MLIFIFLLSIVTVYDVLSMEEGEESKKPIAQTCAVLGLRKISPDNQIFSYFDNDNEGDEESTLEELMALSRQVHYNFLQQDHDGEQKYIIETKQEETREKENTDSEPLSYRDLADELKVTIYYSLIPSSIKTKEELLQLLIDICDWAQVDKKNYGLIYSELLAHKAKLIHSIESLDLAEDTKNDVQLFEESEIFKFIKNDIKNIFHWCGKLKCTADNNAPCGVIRDLLNVGLNHQVKINNHGLLNYLDFQLEPSLAIELLENDATLENLPNNKAFMARSYWYLPGVFMHISYGQMAHATFSEKEREIFKKLFVLLINKDLDANYRFNYGITLASPKREMKVPLLGLACEAFNYDLALIELSLQHGADQEVEYISPILERQIKLSDHVRNSGNQKAIELFEKYQ